MKTAKLVRKLEEGWNGDARLYALSEPLEGYTHCIVSATVVPYGGAETYIFPADENSDKEPLAWGELEGSFRGDMDHARALRQAGYVVED